MTMLYQGYDIARQKKRTIRSKSGEIFKVIVPNQLEESRNTKIKCKGK